MEQILKYFPNLSDRQKEQFSQIMELYAHWNAQINVISRKDIDELYTRHVLHSLGIAKVQPFKAGAKILDIGTGGGFPGIPLAIMFPDCHFHLVDSIGKKIKVVNEVAQALKLNNVIAEHKRAEKIKGEYDFIVSRAVTRMENFTRWTKGKIAKKQQHSIKNGILYLKGGDLSEELSNYQNASIFELENIFDDPFFETKKVVHIPIKFKPLKN